MKDKIQNLSEQLENHKDFINNEEVTKQTLILPFLRDVLGYNITNPLEVTFEYTPKIKGIKNTDKVDCAILKDNNAIMLIECKALGTNLSLKYEGQLVRYFNSLPNTKIAVLTNGQQYQFYTDSDNENNMDDKPYMVFDLLDRNRINYNIKYLEKLTKNNFNIEEIQASAKDLKYINIIKEKLYKEFDNLEDINFIKSISVNCNIERWTDTTKDYFKKICNQAMKLFINEKLDNILNKAKAQVNSNINEDEDEVIDDNNRFKIVTTQEELDGYHIIRAILSKVIKPSRIFYRDTVNYCGIIIDDNIRKQIARLYFNSSNKKFSIFKDNKEGEKIAITSIDDIYKYEDVILESAKNYY